MHLWRRLASPGWWRVHEEAVRSSVGDALAVIEQPRRKKLTLEVACKSSKEGHALVQEFGGRTEKIPRDWLQMYSQAEKNTPVRVGERLVIANAGGTSVSRPLRRRSASHIVIPAGAAFGTGQHVTTTMSLRLLEEITRGRRVGGSLADLGTGSGILALAAKRFGAGRVFAVDNDPRAIATAKTNARLNKIRGIDFRLADARSWQPSIKIDIATANLFSELLIETLPNLRRYLSPDAQVILSGVLRKQELKVIRALRANDISVMEVRRRGKWIAILALKSI
jgi:ribosomal protein L11 methyltransferase